MRYVKPDGTPAIRKHALRILANMGDGQSRSVLLIHQHTGISKLDTTRRAVKDLVDAGMLEQCGTTTAGTRNDVPVYQLAKKRSAEQAAPIVTNNPFIWQTYRQWTPSTLSSKGDQHGS